MANWRFHADANSGGHVRFSWPLFVPCGLYGSPAPVNLRVERPNCLAVTGCSGALAVVGSAVQVDCCGVNAKAACHAALEVGLLRGRSFSRYSPRAGDWLESSSAPSVRSVIQLPALLLSAGFARLLGRRRDPVYDRRSPPAIDPYPAQLSGPTWGLLRSVGGALPWCWDAS